MLLRFCKLCCKPIDPTLVNLQRHYRAASNVRLKRAKGIKDVPTREKAKKVPIITCRRKEFNFYEGQTYSKYDVIPLASKGWIHRESKLDHFTIHPLRDKPNQEEKEECGEEDETATFGNFNLNPYLLEKLIELNMTEPLEIQKRGIPTIMSGYNTILAAETGCGKTLTYLLPMINHVLEWKKLSQRDFNTPLGLIVTPTRELAVQIGLETLKLSKHLDIKTKVITGGKTKSLMREYPLDEVDILVGSFGVISKLTSCKIYGLKSVRHVVLDEADALFHDTFVEKVNVFLRRIPIGCEQTTDERGFPTSAKLTLASATMPSRISEALDSVIEVNSLKSIYTSKLHCILVPQKFLRLLPAQKPGELLKYIKPKVLNRQPVIVFSNENSTCNWVSLFLNECGIKTVHLNGTMSVKYRRGQYAEFYNGHCNVLSTTNAGSRGLDTVMVNHILNYEFPLDTADYIHRCGRTGRVGTVGDCLVTNFISTKSEIQLVNKIERATRKMKPIPLINLLQKEDKEEEPFVPNEEIEAYTERMIEDLDQEDSIPY